MSSNFESEFLDALHAALAELGVQAKRNFVVPSTHQLLDIFLPVPPRAVVELILSDTKSSFDSLLDSAMEREAIHKSEFGPFFSTVVIVIYRDKSEPRQTWFTPTGMMACTLAYPSNAATAVADIAMEISWAFQSARQDCLRGLVPILAIRKAQGHINETELLTELDRQSFNIEELSSESESLLVDHLEADVILPSSDSIRVLEVQSFGIYETFRSIAPEAYPVLRHEMTCLVNEYRSGHFTACAMRAGRSLETMIYELSRRWKVELHDATFGKLDDLRKSIDKVGDLLGDYQSSSDVLRGELGKQMNAALRDLSGGATALLLAVKDVQLEVPMLTRSGMGPRPVVALLKKVRNRYGRLEGVTSSLAAILNRSSQGVSDGSLIERILRIRNKAAHACVDGKPQEIDQETINQLLDDINLVMLMLSNVGIAIQSAHLTKDSATTP